jgi:hypothetical protein
MGQLAAVLERFNRKERNLLIRAVLSNEEPPQLSSSFRTQVTDALGLPELIPADASWWTDYHISWLAGALAIYMTGEDSEGIFPNSGLVEGNQEDVDLVIVTGNRLILIEAKAYSNFGEAQIESKRDRLDLLRRFYLDLAGKSSRSVSFHFALLSINRPNLDLTKWPTWTFKSSREPHEIAWVRLLPCDKGKPILKVTRCDGEGHGTREGTYWRCCRLRSGRRKGRKPAEGIRTADQ